MNVLAFDLGGSGGKVFLGSFNGNRIQLESIHKFSHSPISIGNGLYWNIISIYQHLNHGIQKSLAVTHGQIHSLGIDSFSNDFALIAENGDLLSPVRCYRDPRTKQYESQIYKHLSPSDLYFFTGNQNALFNTYMQLAAMCQAGQKFMLDHCYKLLFIPDLLIYFLTGKTISEYTISSVSQLFDCSHGIWSQPILKQLDLSQNLFGNLTKPGTIVGPTTTEYNQLMQMVGFQVIAVCEHDTASAFVGSVCPVDSVIISSGTWSLVGIQMKHPIIHPYGFQHNIANEGGFENRYRILKNVMGMWIIQQIRSDYMLSGIDYSFADLEEVASKAVPFQYYIDIDNENFFTPGNMSEKIQQVCFRQYGHAPDDLGQIMRCVYESMVFKYRYTIEQLQELTRRHFPLINIVGGGSKDSLMCQFTANVCNRPVVAGPSDASAIGNIIVQLMASKVIPNLEEAKNCVANSFITSEYFPVDPDIWEEQYQLYVTQCIHSDKKNY